MKRETSISIYENTKKLLEENKRSVETWDKFMNRLINSYLMNENPNLQKWQKESIRRMNNIIEDPQYEDIHYGDDTS